jgi:hypothetical protein
VANKGVARGDFGSVASKELMCRFLGRVANKRLMVYGTWKNVRKIGRRKMEK